jgi:hypothetical protein
MESLSEMRTEEIGMPSIPKIKLAAIYASYFKGSLKGGGKYIKQLLGLQLTGRDFMTDSFAHHVGKHTHSNSPHMDFMMQLLPKDMEPLLLVTAMAMASTWELETFVSAVGAVPHAPLSRSVLVRQEDVTAGD